MKTIFVTGDFLVDHHIYEGQRHHFGDQHHHGVCVKQELGGAGLVQRFLVELQAQSSAGWRSAMAVDEASALRRLSECAALGDRCQEQPFSAYAFWRPHRVKEGGQETCWRVAEAMGFGGGESGAGQWPWEPAADTPSSAQVLVISEGGMGFRSRTNVSRWSLPVRDRRLRELAAETGAADPAVLQSLHEPDWIVLKLSAPVGQGDLWRELTTFHADRLVVVVSANELRRADVRLGSGLSWEQTLEQLHRALTHNAQMKSLLQCRHLVIAFGSEGALWLRPNDGPAPVATFLFDPCCVEGEHRHGIEGGAYGYLSCLTATVAAELADSGAAADIEKAMRRGLAAMRHLGEHGHGDAMKPGAGFPAKALATVALAADGRQELQSRSFTCDEVTCPVRPGWSLLALNEAGHTAGSGGSLLGIARRVLLRGADALQAPTLRIGGFYTADRGEIEAIRSLRLLVGRYLANRRADKPLSIGVFGPPGAGKSFAVKQLAKALLRDRLGWLEFNLSQFKDASDIIGALHQVRDKILDGKTPVAFFDEFDSQNFQWLKYLLAPMQDGRFQEGQISHPVGQCLFIFAGGTSHAFEAFSAKGEGAGQPGHEAADHFVLSKGPDFASRLDGVLNVIGPNPRPGGDSCCPVRRALFIRANLGCGDSERLEMHPGLASALLEIARFRHGSRSLSKLLEPFKELRRTQPGHPLGLSSLPPQDQLALHVDLAGFESLALNEEDISNIVGTDELAAAVHVFYREKGRREGWLKSHHDCDFAQLAPFDQASNRAAARRIPAILALAGMKLVAGEATPRERDAADELIRFHLDLLGEAEHDGWMDWHIANGWVLAARNDALQHNHLLKPYHDLPESERAKDRDAVSHYPDIAAFAGLKIVLRCDAAAGTPPSVGS